MIEKSDHIRHIHTLATTNETKGMKSKDKAKFYQIEVGIPKTITELKTIPMFRMHTCGNNKCIHMGT